MVRGGKSDGEHDKTTAKLVDALNKSNAANMKQTAAVAFLKGRVEGLSAEVARLKQERKVVGERLEKRRKEMEKVFKQKRDEMVKRINTTMPSATPQQREEKAGLLDYVKAGFGTMLGIIAALTLVNLIEIGRAHV